MTITPNSIEYFTILGLTIAVVLVKFSLIIYLGSNLAKQKKEGQSMSSDFIKAVLILLLCLAISRIFYMIFDFYYTKFNFDYYPIFPNYLFWKIGQLIAGLGQAYVVFILDKKTLQNKYKGIPGIVMAAGMIALFFYPISTMDDFAIASALYILPSLIGLLLPIAFFQIGHKSTGQIRKTAFTLLAGILIYTIAALVINGGILDALQKAFNRPLDVYMYLLQTGLKLIGIIMIALGATKFQI